MQNIDRERLRRALASVAANGDFMDWLRRELEKNRDALQVASDATDVYRLQGACRVITDLIDELSRA